MAGDSTMPPNVAIRYPAGGLAYPPDRLPAIR